LEKDKKRLCGHPNDEQEGRRSHCEHYERPEMMIVRLPAQWAFFFHGLAGVLRLSQSLKESSQRPDGQVKIVRSLVRMISGICGQAHRGLNVLRSWSWLR
jgi:hypothetical protein